MGTIVRTVYNVYNSSHNYARVQVYTIVSSVNRCWRRSRGGRDTPVFAGTRAACYHGVINDNRDWRMS